MKVAPPSTRGNRLLTRATAEFVSLATLFVAGAVFVANLVTYDQGRTVFGPNLGPDYAAFYSAATIVREGGREIPDGTRGSGWRQCESLYDLSLQQATFQRLFPKRPAGRTGYFPYAPFSIVPYIPLAVLPYRLSFVVWSAISLALFVASIRILLTVSAVGADQRWLYLVAVSFFPYLMECLLGGQASAIGLLSFSLAIKAHLEERPFQAGLWLAFLSYKPTLLALVFLLLVIQRHWRIVAGGLVGGVGFLIVSWALVGTQGLVGFIELLKTYVALRRDSPDAMMWYKYVDMANAAPYTWWRLAAVGLRIGALVPITIVLLKLRPAKHYDSEDVRRRLRFSWALVLACTPVISPHFGVYDSVVVIATFLLVFADIPQRQQASWIGLATILYCSAWFGQLSALLLNVNIYTCCLTIVAGASVVFAARFAKSSPTVPRTVGEVVEA